MPGSAGLVGVLPTAEECHAAARALARRLDAKLIECPPARGLYLACSPEALWLRLRTAGRELAVRAQLSGGQQAYRADRASARGEAIARACGLARHGSRQVVDATAGLGRDAYILAQLGARVTLIERSPVVFALLEDACERAARRAPTLSSLARMRLIAGDAAAWLRTCTRKERPQVVYLDPMYPRQIKRAAPRKEMQVLQVLLGVVDTADTLLQVAQQTATERVVVKRPRHAEPLAGERPDYQIVGRSTRFDVYRGAAE
ncbi:MAG: class I SAM-dependent methyltransferase [Nitrococcus sp.]|nr:class I SAM-dependent methyltransferase [Nitrococcus sp.]